MNIAQIDFYSHQNNTFLHKMSVSIKLLCLSIIILFAVFSSDYRVLAGFAIFLSGLILLLKLPFKQMFLFLIYPMIFLIFYFISIKNLSFGYAFLIITRVLTIVLGLLTVAFTTPYNKVFEVFGKFLPNKLVKIFFLSYRSIFILTEILENIFTAIKLRGGIDFKKPFKAINILKNVIGFLIITSIEKSEKMYEGLKLRGFDIND
ncbi:MAG: CbiQ family ECF transporter T component [Candidatus Gastranaerophilales bacterium]|nr:CbiQ family ECF transporter T component [Candidatus Gastranaerophilales bacterium]